MSIADNVFAIFAKQPLPGEVKTRLAGQTDPAFAARVAEIFLRATLRNFGSLPGKRFIVFAPPGATAYFASLAAGAYELLPQCDGDLGNRLGGFLKDQLKKPGRRVVILGADSPTLPAEHVHGAFAKLEACDVVLGPATDGGYYLLGCTKNVPPIFEGVDWGGSSVLWQTVERLRRAGVPVGLLPPWYDVDTLDDLNMLRGHCEAMRLAGIDPGLEAMDLVPPSL